MRSFTNSPRAPSGAPGSSQCFVTSIANYIVVTTPVLNISPNLTDAQLATLALCDKLPIGGSGPNRIVATSSDKRIRIRISKQYATTAQQANILLNGATILYGKLSPSTSVLGGTFVTELDDLLDAKLFQGDNTVKVTPPAGKQKAILTLTYYTQSTDGEGFIWEQGTGGGTTMVNVDSVDNVYPVWEIEGPAINPILTNITTGSSLGYNGAITNGQKLVVDMLNKTAKINDTSVITNITGDWLYFVKGNNEISYTTNNNDATASTIYWQEVIG